MTKAESNRITRMMGLGCIACAKLDIPHIAQENHHILDGHRRLGDWYTLPLCRGHHQGDWSKEQREVLGDRCVAISDGRKLFYAIYGSEYELFVRVQLRLKLQILWPVSKIIPRGAL